MLYLSRAEEEAYLANPDGTCPGGADFTCRALVLCKKSGKSVGKHLLCVLCSRYSCTTEDEPPYVNVEGDYDCDDYIDSTDRGVYRGFRGPFIKWDATQYSADGAGGVAQTMTSPGQNWVQRVFRFVQEETAEIDEKSTAEIVGKSTAESYAEWSLLSCPNALCKQGLFTIVDHQGAVGFSNVVYDLPSRSLRCVKCSCEAVSHRSKKGLAYHDHSWYTRCFFCDTCVAFDKFISPPGCTACRTQLKKQALEASMMCYYCNVHVNISRRGGAVAYKVLGDGGVAQDLYLCRAHRLRKTELCEFSMAEFRRALAR
jgi:hypothetical protein